MDNEQDLKTQFDDLLKQVNSAEDNHPGDEALIKIIEAFQKCQKKIIELHLFSPNEEFEEIDSQNLKYLLLPFYIGYALTQIQFIEIRLKNLTSADYYLQEFLKLMAHYRLLSDQQKKVWKQMLSEKYALERDDKITNYKESKLLNAQIQNLLKEDDIKVQRQLILSQISIKVFQALDLISSNKQELEMLQYRDKLKKDKDTQQEYLDLQQQPIPKMTIWNVPKLNPQAQSSVFNPMCHDCKCHTESEQRQQIIADVWKPTNQPTMTLDEFADMEIKGMKDQEEKMKVAKAEQEKLEAEKDDDKDYWNDQETLKNRHWDDWKDAHEKGAGNKGGR